MSPTWQRCGHKAAGTHCSLWWPLTLWGGCGGRHFHAAACLHHLLCCSDLVEEMLMHLEVIVLLIILIVHRLQAAVSVN